MVICCNTRILKPLHGKGMVIRCNSRIVKPLHGNAMIILSSNSRVIIPIHRNAMVYSFIANYQTTSRKCSVYSR